ncbi:MAG: outer membrane beta-barrel protein, partial [Bacteroidales bacterium]|nr:outer membrane beta-barrel protein [Bacteroidales bacterium]
MNKVSKYLIIILLLLNKNIFAQDQFKIFGSVYDSLENKVAYATVLLLHSNNSQLAAYAITNSEGYFHLITSKSGLYQLQITFIGYGDYIEEVELNDKKTEVNLGKITLKEQAFLLKEAKVESEILPIIIKGDTTEYDASSFSTGVNTNLADLLNQMPGIDVDRHGNITAQGKKIEKLLVENEEFFGNTHGLVTNNISAEIIDKVQVFDDKSEFTKHTGIDDGNKEATLNLKLKQGKYKGYFGDADIAGGMPNKRYKATGNINRFDKKKQISLLGTSNNINQQVINMYDYLTFTGSVDDAMTNSLDFSEIPINLFSNIGVSNNSLLGANLNYKFKESTKLHLNYMFVNSKNITEYQRTSECFLSSNTYEQYSLNTIDNKINNHIAKADFKSKIGENQNIRIKAFISSNEFENTDQDNTEMILLDSSVYRKTQARKTLESDKLNFNLAADYYLKLNKEGRSIGVELYGKNTLHNKFEHFLNSLNLSNQNNLEKINQSTKFDQKHSIYSFNLFYTEALKNNNYLIFTVERYYNFSEACKTSQNTIDADNQLVIDSLSGSFNNDYNYTYFKLQHRKLALKYNYSSSVRFQHYEHKNTQLTNSYNYIFPEFTFQYNINRTKKTQFEYKTFANMPNLLQSISILDNSNYNYLFIGNPYLVPEYVNYINFNYSTYGVLSQKYFYVGFNSSFKTKQIINSTFVDEDLQ